MTKPARTTTDLSLRTILLIAAAAYLIWTPFYLLWPRAPPEILPAGERVEPISMTGRSDEEGHTFRFYGYKQSKADLEDRRPLAVYEGTRPLPEGYYEFEPVNPKNKWRVVKFKASDGSDPRDNGRRYYAVLPKADAVTSGCPR
jgi:hypothetical protein